MVGTKRIKIGSSEVYYRRWQARPRMGSLHSKIIINHAFLPFIQKKAPFTQNEQANHSGSFTLDAVNMTELVPQGVLQISKFWNLQMRYEEVFDFFCHTGRCIDSVNVDRPNK
jgi:hypothetical protein